MNYRALVALLSSILLSANSIAAPSQQEQEEATIVGACMVTKFMTRTPPISQKKIEKCADAVANMVPKCLGIKESEYNDIIKVCIAKLKTTKCVAGKMDVPLMKYATCEYEKNPGACYKDLGSSQKDVDELIKECK